MLGMTNIKNNRYLPLRPRPVHESDRERAIVFVHDHVYSGKVSKRVRLRSEDLVGDDAAPYGVERRHREYGVACV